MREHAARGGLGNAMIVNTCAVTAEAVRQARQAIRKARRERSGRQDRGHRLRRADRSDRFAAMPEVDQSSAIRRSCSARLTRAPSSDTERVKVNDIMSVGRRRGIWSRASARGARLCADPEGCDHRCTFCIIPFGRGPSRSVPAGEVVAQMRGLVESGYAEIVLTGVDITAYGADLPGEMRSGSWCAILSWCPNCRGCGYRRSIRSRSTRRCSRRSPRSSG